MTRPSRCRARTSTTRRPRPHPPRTQVRRTREGARRHDLQGPRGRLQDVLRTTSLKFVALVEIGEAVGVIAAQSIGEPGTQLAVGRSTPVVWRRVGRTSPRVCRASRRLFRGPCPEGQGAHADRRCGRGDPRREPLGAEGEGHLARRVRHHVSVPSKHAVTVADGALVTEGTELIRGIDEHGNEVAIRARYAGHVKVDGAQLIGAAPTTIRATPDRSRRGSRFARQRPCKRPRQDQRGVDQPAGAAARAWSR